MHASVIALGTRLSAISVADPGGKQASPVVRLSSLSERRMRDALWVLAAKRVWRVPPRADAARH
jgi:hypothetical protein